MYYYVGGLSRMGGTVQYEHTVIVHDDAVVSNNRHLFLR